MAEGVVVGAEQVQIHVEQFHELVVEAIVQKLAFDPHFVHNVERSVYHRRRIFVVPLFLVVLYDLLHRLVQFYELVGKVVETHEKLLKLVQLALELGAEFFLQELFQLRQLDLRVHIL